MSRFKLFVGGQTVLLPPEADIPIPTLRATGDVQQLPLTARPYYTGIAGQLQPAQTYAEVIVRGVDAGAALLAMNQMDRYLRTTTRLYDGARFLPVLRLASRATPEERFAGLSWKLRCDYDLLSPDYYLGPDDRRPRRAPLEQDSGLYVLGAAEIIGGSDEYVDLRPLGGYSLASGTYTAPFSGLTYQTLEVDYDDIN